MKSIQSKNITPSNFIKDSFFPKENSNSFFGKTSNSFFTHSSIQAKLTVDQPNDKHEQEADLMADKVVQRLSTSTADGDSSNNANNLSVQRKCATCEHEEDEKIQKQEADAPVSNAPTLPQTATATPTADAARFIVSDNVAPGVGQMRKTDFLNRLKEEICVTVNQALAGTAYSSDNCPYIQASFARHQNSSPAQIEALINRYCPSAAQVQSAEGIIQQMKLKVYAAAKQWANNGGDLSGITQIFGAMTDGNGSTVSGIASSIGGLFFKAADTDANATQSPHAVMQSLGDGHSLDSSSKGKMESAFGTNFSNVEVHTDSNAAKISANMNARAFTVGNHIAFASQEHKPGTIEGDALLAHELAHVRQQSDGKTNGLQQKSGTENQAFEDEADESAINTVTAIHRGKGDLGKVVKRFGRRLKTGLSIQRCPAHTKNKNLTPTTVGTVDPKQATRDEISNWKSGDPNAILTYDRKMVLIRNLLTGTVSVADQSLILDLIEKSEVVYVKQFIKEKVIDDAVSKFDDANKKRYEAIKKSRALEKDTSGESFQEANIKDMVDNAIANAKIDPDLKEHKSCIVTVRKIVIDTLYQHLEPRELARMEKLIGTECDATGRNNSMEEAMTGVTKAGYAQPLPRIRFEKIRKEIDLIIERGTKTVKFRSSIYPGKLVNSVWGAIEPRIAGKEGWHAFGLAIMDSYHSVTLLVNVRPGGPFLYFVDQVNRSGHPSVHTAKVAPGVQQFLPGKLDAYLEHFADVSYDDYMQGMITRREKKPGVSVKENQLDRMQPDSHIDLWHLSTKKIK
jgi:hypothetical protein